MNSFKVPLLVISVSLLPALVCAQTAPAAGGPAPVQPGTQVVQPGAQVIQPGAGVVQPGAEVVIPGAPPAGVPPRGVIITPRGVMPRGTLPPGTFPPPPGFGVPAVPPNPFPAPPVNALPGTPATPFPTNQFPPGTTFTNFPPGSPFATNGVPFGANTNFPTRILTGDTNRGGRVFTPAERANVNQLIADLNALRTPRATLLTREQLQRDLLAGAQGTARPSDQAVARLVTDLAAVASQLRLAGADNVRLARNLQLLVSGNLSPIESQLILNQTSALLQAGGVPGAQLQALSMDLSNLVNESRQQVPGAAPQPAPAVAPQQ